MEKESNLIKRRMLVFLGIGYLLLGLIMIFSSSKITGFVIVGEENTGVGYFLGILFFVVGVLIIMSARTTEKERTSEKLENIIEDGWVKVSEGGKDKGEYYMKDPQRHFSTTGIVSLTDFRREIGYYKKNSGEEFVEMAKRDYGPVLHKVIESGNDKDRRVALFFLHELEPEYKYEEKKEEMYRVPQEDKKRIKSVFKQWRGGDMTPRQREILRDYNLVYVKGNPHSKIYYAGTESFVPVGNTSSHDIEDYTTTHIVAMIEREKNKKILEREKEEEEKKKKSK